MSDQADLDVISEHIHQAFLEVAALRLTDEVEAEAALQQKFAEFGLTLSSPVVGALASAVIAQSS